MTRTVVLAAMIAGLLAAAFVAWSDERTRPSAVAQRVVATIASRHAGATGSQVAPSQMRVNLPNGTLVDVSLRDAFARCAGPWSDCRAIVTRLADDVDAAERAIRSPRLSDVEPVVTAEAAASPVAGFVSRPLGGTLEVRYAVVRGAATTYLTAAGATAMQATREQLAAAALDALRRRPAPRVVSDGDGVFRVEDAGDAASNLVDPVRMQAIAAGVGATALVCGVPSRGRLWVASAEPRARAAMAERLARGKHEMPNDPARAGVFACAVDRAGG